MAAKYDRNAAAHRRIRMNARGADVVALQRAMNLRAKRKGLGTRVIADGDFGPKSWALWNRLYKLIGLDHRWVTVGNQKLMRDPSKRPARMRAREKKAVAALKAARAKAARGPEAAVRWWTSHLNVKEQPWGSNGGPGISQWEAQFGFGRVPWCGIFVGMGLRAAGLKVNSRVAAVAFIEDDARAGRNGFRRWHPARAAKRGWAMVIGGRGVHVEGVEKAYSWGVLTNGGNTSCEGCTGSQSNGGQSARRRRPWASCHGAAEPAY